jgi:hypothetical protein
MFRKVRRPSPALIIATTALFLALGGGSYALATSGDKHIAKIAKTVANQQITARARKLSVGHANTAANATHARAADLATNATHANSADLATNATHAASADTATNATQLGGQPASAYGRVVPINFNGGYGSDFASDHHALFTIAGVTVGVNCANNGSNISAAQLTLVSPTNGHFRSTWTTGGDGSTGVTHVTDQIAGSVIPDPIAGDGSDHGPYSGSAVYDSQGNVVTLTFSSEPEPGFLTQCHIHGIAVVTSSS